MVGKAHSERREVVSQAVVLQEHAQRVLLFERLLAGGMVSLNHTQQLQKAMDLGQGVVVAGRWRVVVDDAPSARRA